MIRYFLIILGLIILLLPKLHAQRSDVIHFNAGNRITGEIKRLQFGALLYETDDAGDLDVKWINVVKIKTNSILEITLENGERIEGSLDTTDSKYEVRVISETNTKIVPISKIVEIQQLQNRFISRFDGFVKFGFSYTKASDVLQTNSTGDIRYITFSDELTATGNLIITDQFVADSVIRNRKQDLQLFYRRFFKQRWFAFTTAGIQQNIELGLLRRGLFGLGGGKSLFHTNLHMFRIAMGAMGTNEIDIDNNEQNNAEGIFDLYYRVYKKNVPKVSFIMNATAYPSFTIPGRVRVDGNISLDTELISDFTIGITNYHNYDSNPLAVNGNNYDWGVVLNFGYGF